MNIEKNSTVQTLKMQKESIIAILFASGDPLESTKIANALEISTEVCATLLLELKNDFEKNQGALQIMQLDTRYQISTHPRFTPIILAALEQRKSAPLSQASLEILAIIAYNQPVTRAFIEQVRGVECGSTISGLMDKGLCEEAGRLELPGRPISYQVTDNFLRTFGLSSLDMLPELRIGEPAQTETNEVQFV